MRNRDDDDDEDDVKNLEEIQQKNKKRKYELRKDLRRRNTHRSRIPEVEYHESELESK